MVPPEFLDARNSLTEPWQSGGLALSHFLPFFLLQLALGRHLGVAFFSPTIFFPAKLGCPRWTLDVRAWAEQQELEPRDGLFSSRILLCMGDLCWG